MLKKLFKRRKKGLKKKKSKLNSNNKLNISSSNLDTDINTLSFIESNPNMYEEDDDEIDLPKLNFTCILNNPLEDIHNTSLFGQLLMRFQEDQRVVTEEERIRKEGYKFDLIDIIQEGNPSEKHNNSFIIENKVKKNLEKEGEEEEEEELDDILNDLKELENIFSVKKSLDQCIKETNEKLYKGKTTFKLKKFIDLSYNNYIAKIKHEYLIYRDNHNNNIMNKIDLEDLLNKNIKIETKEEIIKIVNNYKRSLNESMNKIDKEYIVDTNNFKINDNLLNMNIGQILETTTKIIEQKGILELEAEKSNVNYNIIRHFFNNNYPKLINEVNNVHFKIDNLMEKKNHLKSKFLEVTEKLIMMKMKRQNLVKVNSIYKKMLEAGCNKIENINSIIEIREMKQNLQNVPNIGLNIIKKINDELNDREINKNLENINKITTLIKNEINNFFDIVTYSNENEMEEEEEDDDEIENNPKKKYNYKYYNFDEKLFKKIFQFKNIKEIIFLVINTIDEQFIKEQIYSLLELSNNKEEFMKKVSNVLISSIEQVLLTTLGKILALKNLNEILFLFYMGIMSQSLFDSINKMFNEKDKEIIIVDVKNKLFDIVDKNLSFIVDDLSSYNQNIEKFIIKNKILNEVYGKIPIFLLNKNFLSKIENYELNFLNEFAKIQGPKIKDELTLDNLRNLDNFSYEYQKLINIIFTFDIESINKDEEKKIEDLNNNILLDINLNTKKGEPKEIAYIEIPIVSEGNNIKKNCRLMNTSLDLIRDTINAIKMILFFNKNNYSQIFIYLYEIFNNFINLSNDIVLETKGQIKNITQNELAASYSSVYLIREITKKIILFFNSSQNISEETSKKYNDLENQAKDFLDKNLLKLTNMIQGGIKEASLDEFTKIINLEKYPVPKNSSLPINDFATNLVKLVAGVYKSLKNCYEDKTISKIILDCLNNYNTELEKILEKKELNTEEEKKIFKKDFAFIRKNIDKGIEDIDFKSFKKKFVSIYKKLLPKNDKEKDE